MVRRRFHSVSKGLAALLIGGFAMIAAAQGPLAREEAPVSIEPRMRPAREAADLNPVQANIRVDSTLVLINVTVTNPLGQVVTGLMPEHFRLMEDGEEQEIKEFSSEDAPMSVGLVFDASGSMGTKLNKAREAAAEFFKTANPADEFFLIQFSNRPQLVVPFTWETEEIQNRMAFTESRGRTALLDALYMAMDHMKQAKNPRKAILVLSDGGDNSSRYTQSEIKNLVREADVQVYAIGIFEPRGSRGRTAEELNGPSLLSELAEQTGGRHFPVENVNELPDIAAKIGVELRNQYVLGYTPTNTAKDGKYRRVRVQIEEPRGVSRLRPNYRSGYYAPSQ